MSDVLPLGDALDVLIDHRGKTPKKLGGDFSVEGVEVISAIHLKDGRIDWRQRRRFVDTQMFKKWMPVRLEADDLLLTSEAPLGEVALVPDNRDLVLSQRLFALRGKPEVLHTPYLYYFFQTDEGRSALNARASGTTVVGIRQAELVRIPIPLPPIQVQRRIAGVLRQIDDLIDTNRQLASNLESLARAAGRQFLASLPAADGSAQIADIATIDKGYSYRSSELTGEGGWLVGLKNVGRDGVFRDDGFKPLTANVKPSQTLENGDLIVAQTDLTQAREVIGRPVRVRRGSRRGQLVASLDLVIVRPREHVPAEFLHAVLESDEFRQHALGFCNGTTVLHMGAAAVPSFQVTVPDPDDMSRFARRVRELRNGVDVALDEAEELRTVRDELLPLLVSGRISVPEA